MIHLHNSLSSAVDPSTAGITKPPVSQATLDSFRSALSESVSSTLAQFGIDPNQVQVSERRPVQRIHRPLQPAHRRRARLRRTTTMIRSCKPPKRTFRAPRFRRPLVPQANRRPIRWSQQLRPIQLWRTTTPIGPSSPPPCKLCGRCRNRSVPITPSSWPGKATRSMCPSWCGAGIHRWLPACARPTATPGSPRRCRIP